MSRRKNQLMATLLAGTLVVTSGILPPRIVKAEEVGSAEQTVQSDERIPDEDESYIADDEETTLDLENTESEKEAWEIDTEPEQDIQPEEVQTDVLKGDASYDYVYFGHYLQEDTNGDGVVNDQDEKQSIKWRILSQNGNDAYVLSEKILDCKSYNVTYNSITWETCTLRTWLNNDFYNTAFTTAEQGAIIEQTVVNDDNPWYGTAGGNNTVDKVYLPSIADMLNTSYGFSADYSDDARVGVATAYAKQQHVYVNSSNGGSWWWLRSPGHYTCDASSVSDNGLLFGSGCDGVDLHRGARPALHINLSSPYVTKEPTSGEENNPSKDVTTVFDDIKSSDWWYPAVQYAYDNGIMTGKSTTTFDPTGKLTRDQFVQVLYSNSGKPGTTITNSFKDVEENGWYKDAVLWANENGVTAGKGNGIFGVGQDITRQELATMLYKYATLYHYDLTTEAGKANQFVDSAQISDWAQNALDWAVTQGIMSGKAGSGDTSTYRLDPTGTATRAECAAMMRMLLINNK